MGDEKLKDELEREVRAIISGDVFHDPEPVKKAQALSEAVVEAAEAVEKVVKKVANDKPARKKRAANA